MTEISLEIKQELESLPCVEVLDVKTLDDRDSALACCKDIKRRLKRLEDLRKSLTQPLDDAKRRIMDLFAGPKNQLEAAEAQLKRGVLVWDQAERARRVEMERKLQAERDAKAKAEREALERAAAAAIRAGKESEAEALVQQADAVIVEPVTFAPAPVAEKGAATRKIWRLRIVDANAVPRQFLAINEQLLLAHCRATGGAEIAGVEFYQEESLAVRA
jgi:hypothetical protein